MSSEIVEAANEVAAIEHMEVNTGAENNNFEVVGTGAVAAGASAEESFSTEEALAQIGNLFRSGSKQFLEDLCEDRGIEFETRTKVEMQALLVLWAHGYESGDDEFPGFLFRTIRWCRMKHPELVAATKERKLNTPDSSTKMDHLIGLVESLNEADFNGGNGSGGAVLANLAGNAEGNLLEADNEEEPLFGEDEVEYYENIFRYDSFSEDDSGSDFNEDDGAASSASSVADDKSKSENNGDGDGVASNNDSTDSGSDDNDGYGGAAPNAGSTQSHGLENKDGGNEGGSAPSVGATQGNEGGAIPNAGATQGNEGGAIPNAGATQVNEGGAIPNEGATQGNEGGAVLNAGAIQGNESGAIPNAEATQGNESGADSSASATRDNGFNSQKDSKEGVEQTSSSANKTTTSKDSIEKGKGKEARNASKSSGSSAFEEASQPASSSARTTKKVGKRTRAQNDAGKGTSTKKAKKD